MVAVERFFQSDLGEYEARQRERFFQFGFPDVIQNLESGYECSIMMVGGSLFHALLHLDLCMCLC